MPTLSRERNRLTLRAYLRTLLANPVLAASDAFQSFLLETPIQLTSTEVRDVEIREEMDRIREEEVRSFRIEVEERVEELERHLRGFREDLVQSGQLSRRPEFVAALILACCRRTDSRIRNDPKDARRRRSASRIPKSLRMGKNLVSLVYLVGLMTLS